MAGGFGRAIAVGALLLAVAGGTARHARAEDVERLSKTELSDLFSEAKSLFRGGSEAASSDLETAGRLYRGALLRYERIVREGGIRNGRLFYNMGNIAFRMGDIGGAILNYRRAERYIPNDPNLRANLAYAASKRVDQIEEQEAKKVLETLLFFHYDITPKARLILFVVLAGAAWIFAAIHLFVARPPVLWGIIATAFLAAAFLGSLAADQVSASRNRAGVLLASEVVARKGDGDSYQPSFTEPLHAGTEFRLVEERTDWLYIELADGRRSWIPVDDAALVE